MFGTFRGVTRLRCFKWFHSPYDGIQRHRFGFAECFAYNDVVLPEEDGILRTSTLSVGQIYSLDGTKCRFGISPFQQQIQHSHSTLREPNVNLNWKMFPGRGLHAYWTVQHLLHTVLPTGKIRNDVLSPEELHVLKTISDNNTLEMFTLLKKCH